MATGGRNGLGLGLGLECQDEVQVGMFHNASYAPHVPYGPSRPSPYQVTHMVDTHASYACTHVCPMGRHAPPLPCQRFK